MKNKIIAAKVTAEMNAVLMNPLSTKPIRRELQKQGISGRPVIQNPFISDTNACNRKKWYLSHKAWSIEQWKTVILPDESSFSLCPSSERVYVWRTPSKAYYTDCFFPRIKHVGGFVVFEQQ